MFDMGYTVDGQFKKPWKITIWYTVDWYRKFEIYIGHHDHIYCKRSAQQYVF